MERDPQPDLSWMRKKSGNVIQPTLPDTLPPNNKLPEPDLSWMKPKVAAEPTPTPGVFETLWSGVKQGWNVAQDVGGVGQLMGAQGMVGNTQRGAEILMRAADANANGGAARARQHVIGKLSQIATINGSREVLSGVIKGAGEALGHPLVAAAGLPNAFVVQPIKDVSQALLGATIGEDQIRVLTPDERSQSAKNTIANVVTLGVGKAFTALGSAAKGAEAADALTLSRAVSGADVSAQELQGVRRAAQLRADVPPAHGALAGAVMRTGSAAAHGAGLGAVYGAIESSGEDDRVAKITSAIVNFGTLGAATHALFGDNPAKAKQRNIDVAFRAEELANIKQLQYLNARSIDDMSRIAAATVSSDNLVDAVIGGRINPEMTAPVHVNGLSSEKIADLQSQGYQVLSRNTGTPNSNHLIWRELKIDNSVPVPQPTVTPAAKSVEAAPVVDNAPIVKRVAELKSQIADLKSTVIPDAVDAAGVKTHNDSYAARRKVHDERIAGEKQSQIQAEAAVGFYEDQLAQERDADRRNSLQNTIKNERARAEAHKAEVERLKNSEPAPIPEPPANTKNVDAQKEVETKRAEMQARLNVLQNEHDALVEKLKPVERRDPKNSELRKNWQDSIDFRNRSLADLEQLRSRFPKDHPRYKELMDMIDNDVANMNASKEVIQADPTNYTPLSNQAIDPNLTPEQARILERNKVSGWETLTMQQRSVWVRSGLLPEQLVSHEGRVVKFNGNIDLVDGKVRVEVEDKVNGNTYKVMRDQLSHLTDAEHADVPLNTSVKSFFDNLYNKYRASLNEALPDGMSLEKHTANFFNDNKLSIDPKLFMQEMHDRIANEAIENLDAGDRAALDWMRASRAAESAAYVADRRMGHVALTDAAIGNNMFVSYDMAGNYQVRDAESGHELHVNPIASAAAEWINSTSTARPVDVINGMGVSVIPDAPQLGSIPNGNAIKTVEQNYNIPDAGRVEKFLAAAQTIAKVITPTIDYFKSLDTLYKDEVDASHQEAYEKALAAKEAGGQYDNKILAPKPGTSFFRKFDRTQKMFMQAYAEMKPHVEQLRRINKMLGDATPVERENLGRWMETMTPDEIINKRYSRVMNPHEIEVAQWIHRENLDTGNARAYQRTEKGILKQRDSNIKEAIADQKKKFNDESDAGKPIAQEIQDQLLSGLERTITEEAQQKIDAARQEFSMSDKDLQLVDVFKSIEQEDRSDIALGPIMELSAAYKGGSLSRAEFAAKNGMNMNHIRAGLQLDAMYKQLADKFGISKEARMGGYMARKQLYIDGNIERGINYIGTSAKDGEFFAKLTRVGDITQYELDPIVAMNYYIRAGFLDGAVKELDQSVIAWNDDLKKVKAGSARENIRAQIMQYVETLKGRPPETSIATEELWDKFKRRMGYDSPTKAKDLVNMVLQTTSLGTLGFRPSVGIRDVMATTNQINVMFGSKFTTEVLKHATSAKLAADLEAAGKIKSGGTLNNFTDTEQASDLLSRGVGTIQGGLDRVAEVGMKFEGAKAGYARMHAGVYQAMYERVAALASRVERGAVKDTQTGYKDVLLSNFDIATQREFTQRFESGNYEDAADFLARAADNATIVQYGLGNNPAGWRTMRGRMLTQFGSFPAWYVNGYLKKVLTTGTVMDKTMRVARIAAASYAISKLEEESGINLSSLHTFHPLAYSGGIGVSTYSTVKDAMGAQGPVMQKAAHAELWSVSPWSPKYVTEDGEQYFDHWQTNIAHAWLPGSSEADAIVRAYHLSKNGHNMLEVGANALGFQSVKGVESGLDTRLGFRPTDVKESAQ